MGGGGCYISYMYKILHPKMIRQGIFSHWVNWIIIRVLLWFEHQTEMNLLWLDVNMFVIQFAYTMNVNLGECQTGLSFEFRWDLNVKPNMNLMWVGPVWVVVLHIWTSTWIVIRVLLWFERRTETESAVIGKSTCLLFNLLTQ